MGGSSTKAGTFAATRALAIATVVVLAAVLAHASAALAADVPIGGGEARLSLTSSLLHRAGIAVQPLGPAKLKGRTLTLPVTSGALDPKTGTGTVTLAGGLRLSSGGRGVALRRISFDASSKSLSAIVAGKRIRLARLSGAKLERRGFDVRLQAKRLPLSGAGATALNSAPSLPTLFRPGRSLGSVNGIAEASSVAIEFGTIAIGGPDTTFSKLESLKVQMGIWGATGRWKAPGENFFLFDIAKTTIAPDASTGILDTAENDGITMQIFEPPPREMLLRHPVIDLSTRNLTATLTPLSKENPITGTIATLDYTPAKIQIRPKVGTFELLHINAISTQFIADQLNARFNTPGVFQPGETLARISIVLHAR